MEKFNFSAGPAVLPQEVLSQITEEMADWQGSGLSILSMGHRTDEFTVILQAAEQDCRALLGIPDNYRVLFMQGGAVAQNAIIPLNLVKKSKETAVIDFIHTGYWSGRAMEDVAKYACVHVAASAKESQFTTIPHKSSWQLSPSAEYVHVCTNETVHGVEFNFTPDVGDVPLVADMSSHIFSRPIDVTKYGVIFAGAQKNMGIAGLTLVIVRDDLICGAQANCPAAFDWVNVAKNHSRFNTPPVFAIYVAGLMFKWLLQQGGLENIAKQNSLKSHLLYDCIDASSLYANAVSRDCRSRMNVPFSLRDPVLDTAFLAAAKQQGLLQLQGHRVLGGMRASLYNAMPAKGVESLVDFMREFERLS